MKLFNCGNCGQILFFENDHCEKCGHELGFVTDDLKLYALEPAGDGAFRLFGNSPGLFKSAPLFKYCKNHDHKACNWLVPATAETPYCAACELNHTIPDLAQPANLEQWQLIEVAKHRLIYSLLQLKLPLVSKARDLANGLSFDFLTETTGPGKVLTGHENGLITLNVNEADDVRRESARKQMHEPYRTLLGHFRHEVGHYYWDRLIANSKYIEKFRELFGDERANYATALKNYYDNGAPSDWNNGYISAYATSHPWEDWAETWAHYLHIIDTLETADAFGMKITPRVAHPSELNTVVRINPYDHKDFNDMVNLWLPLTLAINSLNRSMGNHDLYPFVIPPKVIQKLSFIHQVCYESRV